jgi:hypothetical protein
MLVLAPVARRLARLPDQIGVDQRFQIAIQHAVHVADGELGAVVLDHAIGRQHIAANLAAEVDLQLRGLGLARFLPLLLQLELIQRARSCFMALSRFLCCERSFWHCTTILVGKCVRCAPPNPSY